MHLPVGYRVIPFITFRIDQVLRAMVPGIPLAALYYVPHIALPTSSVELGLDILIIRSMGILYKAMQLNPESSLAY